MQNFLNDKFYSLKSNLISPQFKKRIPYISALFAALLAAFLFSYLSLHTVRISDDTGVYTVKVFSADIDKAMDTAGFGNDRYRVLSKKVDGNTVDLSVKRTFDVTVISGNQKTEISTTGGTVRSILKSAGIKVDRYDKSEPSLDTVLRGKTTVNFTDVEYITGDYTEEIPCKTQTVYSQFVNLGTTTVKSGHNGVKQVIYTAKLVNGVECEKSILSEQVISLAVDNITTVGTGAANSQAYDTCNYVGCLTKEGGVYKNPYTGFKETWYSQKVLPGHGLTIPGRHVNSEGFVCDGEGYICIASSELPRGTIVPISRGVGKVYDSGCAKGVIDVYVNW